MQEQLTNPMQYLCEYFINQINISNNEFKYNIFYNVILKTLFNNININIIIKKNINLDRDIHYLYILFNDFCYDYNDYYESSFDFTYLNNKTFLTLVNQSKKKYIKKKYISLIKKIILVLGYKKKYFFFITI